MLTAAVYLLAGDRAAAEDVVHDVFVALSERVSTTTLRGSLRNYLLTCCLNRARDVLRRRRDQPVELEILHNLVSADSYVPPETNRFPASDRDVAFALLRLPHDQREVVTLHIHGGQTFREIAEMLCISINTAQSRYRYALANLRKHLAEIATPRGSCARE